MAELVKHAPQYAQQTLRIVNGGDKDQIIRRAYCQAHQQWSSQFQGVDTTGWLFRCANSKLHMSHLFHTKPPLHYPKTLDEFEGWAAEQRKAAVIGHAGQ